MASRPAPIAALREEIARLFDESELKTLCVDMDVDYESLPTVGKASKVRELLLLLQRTDRLDELLSNIKRLRPRAHLPRIPRTSRPSIGQERTLSFSADEFFDVADIDVIVRNVIGWFEKIQNPDGGLPTDDEGSPSGTWATSGVLWAAWTAGVTFRRRWMRRGLDWVLKQRSEDGGIPICRPGDPDITDGVALTLLCLRLAVSDDNVAAYRRALTQSAEWLLTHRVKREGWRWRDDSSEQCSVASTTFALRALRSARAASRSLVRDIDAVLAEVCDWLMAIRNDDGGWGARAGDPSRAAVTALAALALIEADPAFDAEASTNFVLDAQEKDGGWPDTIERPSLATVTRIGTANCLQMLAAVPWRGHGLALMGGLRALLGTYEYPRFRYRDTIVLTWPTRDALLALTRLGQGLGLARCRHGG